MRTGNQPPTKQEQNLPIYFWFGTAAKNELFREIQRSTNHRE